MNLNEQVEKLADTALSAFNRLETATKRNDELERALRALLENVEQFGFERISIEHELAHGVQLARKALGPVCSMCRSRHGTDVVHSGE